MKYNLRSRLRINYNDAAEFNYQNQNNRFKRLYRDQLNSEIVVGLNHNLKSASRYGKIRIDSKFEKYLRESFEINGRFKNANLQSIRFFNSFNLVHENFKSPLNAVQIDEDTFVVRLFKKTIKYMDQDLNEHSIKSTYLSFKFIRINVVYQG